MQVTRLGISALTRDHGGSVALPEGITLYCPQCGTEAADKGQCIVSIVPMPFKEHTFLNFWTDCRSCGRDEPGVALNQEQPFVSTHKFLAYTEIKDDGEYVRLRIKGAWARLLKDHCVLDKVKKTVVISIVYAKSVGIE